MFPAESPAAVCTEILERLDAAYQGSSFERRLSSLIQLLIHYIKNHYSHMEGHQVEARLRGLEDFLWDFSWLATSDGTVEECDRFITKTKARLPEEKNE